MSSQNEEDPTTLYLRNAGGPNEGRYRLGLDHLAWLIEHCTRLGALRLELLRGLQAALPKSDDGDSVTELKELLTNLIIMQTRLADREASLHDALRRLVDDGRLDAVFLDEELLREAIQQIIDAPTRVRSVSGGGI
ncbi:MAG: hypothetical protein IH861_16805 [Chloroflexi bacterium]|nr:hypothetical protein [Chloroflexota bacterium]